MEYDVILATRNRVEALHMSLPLIINQNVKPKNIIVVDSSDEHYSIKKKIQNIVDSESSSVKLVLLKSEPNLPAQRNIGLEYVKSPVVMFPDDDSLWFNNTAEAILDIYKRDYSSIVGGVTLKESSVSPLQFKTSEVPYKKSYTDLLKSKINPIRNRFENKFFKNPTRMFAYNNWTKLDLPDWLDYKDILPVEAMTGFKMSFRTGVIRSVGGFDETLGSVVGYGLGEDIDASITVQKKGFLLVGSHHSQIYHHRFPGIRAMDFQYGFIQIYNMLYIYAKNFQRDSPEWKSIDRYFRYKLLLYSLKKTNNENERYNGAKSAWESRDELLNTNESNIHKVYYKTCKRFIG